MGQIGVADWTCTANLPASGGVSGSAERRDVVVSAGRPESLVEFDEAGAEARKASDAAREAWIAEIRRQIAAGTYLTEDKIDVVVERLCELLRGQVADVGSAAAGA
jgi:hypothetical protein